MAEGVLNTKDIHFEVLMNIADSYLPIIADRYRREHGIKYADLALTSGWKIRTVNAYSLLRFLSVGMKWKEDGTVFMLMEFHKSYELAVFSLDMSGRQIYEGLLNTRRIHFQRPLTIRAIHHNLYPTVLRALQERHLKIRTEVQKYVYCLPIAAAYEFDMNCPFGYELRLLDKSCAEIINKHWQERFEESVIYLRIVIGTCGGWGLFNTVSKELVSWAVRLPLGDIGIVHTVEQHQRKGYATIVLKKLSKCIAYNDEYPIAFLPLEHEPAQALFEKVGYQNDGIEHTIQLESVKDIRDTIPVYAYDFDIRETSV